MGDSLHCWSYAQTAINISSEIVMWKSYFTDLFFSQAKMENLVLYGIIISWLLAMILYNHSAWQASWGSWAIWPTDQGKRLWHFQILWCSPLELHFPFNVILGWFSSFLKHFEGKEPGIILDPLMGSIRARANKFIDPHPKLWSISESFQSQSKQTLVGSVQPKWIKVAKLSKSENWISQ